MNMFKKTGGFTLVELIVVIAILAILAGVAIPAYSGYIAKAEQAADLQTLSAVNTAAQGVAIGKNATVTGISVAKTDKGVTVTVTAHAVGDTATAVAIGSDEVTTLTGTLTFGKNFKGATWALDAAGVGKWTLN